MEMLWRESCEDWLFRVSCEESIHHRGTEFAEFGEFLNQTCLLCALRASAVQSPSSASRESLKTREDLSLLLLFVPMAVALEHLASG